MSAYERDPYLTELEVRLVDRGNDDRGAYLLLDDTVLYPEGGGQPADRGRLGAVEIRDVRRVDGRIRHYADDPIAAAEGVLHLDWERRFDHMQQHTAQHVITAVAADELGWQTTSFHLGGRSADIELDAGVLDGDTLLRLEEGVNRIVREGRDVTARRVPSDSPELDAVRTRGLPADHRGDVRLVEIAGLDLNTCGGTHVASTAEIGVVKLLGTERMRGGTRLFWVAGDRVRHLLDAHERRAATLREILETSDTDLADTAAAKLERLKETERRIRDLEGELAGVRAADLAGSDAAIHDIHYQQTGAASLQGVARQLLAGGDRRPGLLTASDGEATFFVVVAPAESGVDLASVGPRVAELLGGRGGGSGDLFQGKAASLAARDDALALLVGPEGRGDR